MQFAPTFQLRRWTSAVPNISVHQWDKRAAESNGDGHANPGAILAGFDQDYFLVEDLNNPWLWHVGSGTEEPLSDWLAAQTLPQNTLPPASMKENQASASRHTIKARRKSDRRSWTWRTLIISFHLCLGAARNYQQKSLYSPPTGFSLIIGDFLISIRSSIMLIGFRGKVTSLPSLQEMAPRPATWLTCSWHFS